jgi:hypothetical protein
MYLKHKSLVRFAHYTGRRILEKWKVVIWKAPVEFDRKLSHHKEHEDHEGNKKYREQADPFGIKRVGSPLTGTLEVMVTNSTWR